MRRVRPRWLSDDSGQGLVEYALILALTSVAMALALLFLRDTIGNSVQSTSNRLEASVPSAGAPASPGTPAGGNGNNGGGNGQGNNGNGNGNGGPNGNWNGGNGNGGGN